LEEETYSRTVYALKGQIIEIPYRGTGWVYLGESSGKPGIVYNSRRLEPEGMSFVFRAEDIGIYELKFYRQDFIRDYIINDHVRVIVETAPETAVPFGVPVESVTALPRWPELSSEISGTGAGSPPSAAQRPSESAAVGGAVTPSTAASATQPRSGIAGEGIVPGETQPPKPLPEEYLRRGREEYEAGHIQQALAILEQFRSRFPQGSDESWWLLGQLYEANSPYRNIRLSMDCYRNLIRDYPQSLRYGDARRRIAYLERYYFNIQ
jgi:hypothetical protein